MSTPATFTFDDGTEKFTVYKHWDGFPSDAVKRLESALTYAWPLPRFEASDYAAAFVAANKPKFGGDVRLCHSRYEYGMTPYRYEVKSSNGKLTVVAHRLKGIKSGAKLEKIFTGTFDEFKEFARNFKT